ncbi:shikimate kinase [Mesorhizobium sp. YIM 152430]|uniref:shikimate kinase n=1 Tax=Mesorhizobium sp. YIM 152430 TaxID=3031761 RepID=UPI0023D9F9B2|nr:shikimate kinase [Mesorhizobium sp. YIM 152430]MDF1598196.1 shikimate kinase [Mesorhizobium sp. YIM 152430]
MGATEMAGLVERVRAGIGTKTLVLVGLMGAGKTSVGRKLAQTLQLPFADSDHEIENVSRMTVPELFEAYGEVEFRALEQRVVTRLVADGPAVIGTGGGAFMNADTRAAIRASGISIWLKADIDTLMERVARRQNRPLLKTSDPRAVMRKLMEDRYPVYGEADVTIVSRDARHATIAAEIIKALDGKLAQSMTRVG